jgi:hypothetical protein
VFIRTLVLTAILAVFSLFGTFAFASPVTYDLTIDHCSSPGCGKSPFGTVVLQQVGANTVKVTVNLSTGYSLIETGLNTFVFDVAGSATIAGLTSGYAAAMPAPGVYHQDGFGDFPYAIECTGCGNGGSAPLGSTLTFTVTETGLTPAGFISNGTTKGTPAVFSADVLAPNGNTGPVGTDIPNAQAPEPASMALFGTGLLAIGAFVRKRFNSNHSS